MQLAISPSIGIDLVYIPEFQQRLEQSGGIAAIFTSFELSQNQKLENLAGIFAAKEAFMKALGKKIDWRDVWIEKSESGKPILISSALSLNQTASVSISHDGEYAIAVVSIS